MKKRWVALPALVGLWAVNSSYLAGVSPDAQTRIIAHRGVHQTFSADGVGRDDCTATRIDPVTHSFIENTLRSMQAAFAASADVVELDIHLTPDGKFAVFHDWTLECRTNGAGITEKTNMSVLKALDVGFGYTADGGKTFPLRGKGIGMMPEIEDVFAAFPDRQFLVNFKSNRVEEGVALAELVARKPQYRARIFGVYGGLGPTRAALERIPDLRGYDKKSLKTCLGTYLAVGWSGFVPESCRHTIINIPKNLAPFFWGYPHRMTKRFADHGSMVILSGNYGGRDFSTGIDGPDDILSVPAGFDGFVWTNRIQLTGHKLTTR